MEAESSYSFELGGIGRGGKESCGSLIIISNSISNRISKVKEKEKKGKGVK